MTVGIRLRMWQRSNEGRKGERKEGLRGKEGGNEGKKKGRKKAEEEEGKTKPCSKWRKKGKSFGSDIP